MDTGTAPAVSPKPRQTALWMRLLRATAVGAATATVLMSGYVMLFENSFIYFPARGHVGPCPTPGGDVYLTTADGVKIHGWHVTHPQARVSLLYVHGNAGNIDERREFLEGLRSRLPANVLLIDYRGFGNSEGSPDEAGVYRDARAAWDWLAQRAPPERIVILGKSLGGAVAAELASRVSAGGLIIQNSFTSAAGMSRIAMPYFPVGRWLLRSKFDTLAKVPAIRCPKLIIHTEDDEMIPFRMGRQIFEAAAPPKEFAAFQTGGHNAVFIVNADAYYARVRQFVETIK